MCDKRNVTGPRNHWIPRASFVCPPGILARQRRGPYDGADSNLVPSAESDVSKKKNQRNRREQTRPVSLESRNADALTVAWMMSVIATVLCGLVGGVVLLALSGRTGAETPRMFGRLMHFSALVAAVLSLVLLAVVLKVRRQPPPTSIVWFAVIAAMVVIGAAFLY